MPGLQRALQEGLGNPVSRTIAPQNKAWLLAAIYLGTFMALLDVSIVNVALSDIQHSLATGIAGLQWVVDAYALCFSTLMLSAGALGDRYGRRLVWIAGVVAFTIGSAVCAFAPSLPVLIAGRALQGVGASTIIPGGLSLLVQGWPDPHTRGRVIGNWSAFAGFSMVVGPIIGGFLVDYAGWPSIFLINLPIGAITVVVGLARLRESADPEHAALDPLGQVLGVVWLFGLSYGLIVGGAGNWARPDCIAALALAAVGVVAFVAQEARTRAPMLPLVLFRDANFAATSFAAVVMGFSGFASYFFLALFLQQGQGFSASATGLAYLPLGGVQTATAALTGRLISRFGAHWPMTIGYCVMGIGLWLMALIAHTTHFLPILGVFVVLGIAMGLSIPSSTAAGLHGIARERSGMASAIINCGRQIGNTVGIALLGALLASAAAAGLAQALDGNTSAARHLLADHTAVPASLSALVIHHFEAGFRLATLTSGTLAFATGLLLAGVGKQRKG